MRSAKIMEGMYLAEVILGREGAIEVLRKIAGEKDSAPYIDSIASGMITYTKGFGQSAIELIIHIAGGNQPVPLFAYIPVFAKDGAETTSAYMLLEGIYREMKAKHREIITPLGNIGPQGTFMPAPIDNRFISSN